jgi:hypothetical protein
MNVIYQFTPHQIEELHTLYQKEWWTIGRTLEETRFCVSGSQICIGIIDESGSLKGFERVITDFIFKALIFDVIVSDDQRESGLGSQLINLVKSHQKPVSKTFRALLFIRARAVLSKAWIFSRGWRYQANAA